MPTFFRRRGNFDFEAPTCGARGRNSFARRVCLKFDKSAEHLYPPRDYAQKRRAAFVRNFAAFCWNSAVICVEIAALVNFFD